VKGILQGIGLCVPHCQAIILVEFAIMLNIVWLGIEMAAKKKTKQIKKKAAKKAKTISASNDTIPGEIEFHYLKGKSFRNVHADGFFGGVTPVGKIHMTAYSERRPIPKVTHHPVTSVGPEGLKLGSEVQEKRESLEGIIREVEVGIYFDLAAAYSLRTWLNEKIETIEKGTPEGNSE